MHDETSLERFTVAQEGTWTVAMSEVDTGFKRSHWMWFIYPQLRGLGHSHRAQYFGIADADEARRYLAHPLLGPRLVKSFERLKPLAGQSPQSIFGAIDACKLQSCATLFASVASDTTPFEFVLDQFYGGEPCPLTRDMLESEDH